MEFSPSLSRVVYIMFETLFLQRNLVLVTFNTSWNIITDEDGSVLPLYQGPPSRVKCSPGIKWRTPGTIMLTLSRTRLGYDIVTGTSVTEVQKYSTCSSP